MNMYNFTFLNKGSPETHFEIFIIFQVCFGQHFADHWCQEGEQTSGPLLDCLYCWISYLVMSQPSINLSKEIYALLHMK